MWGVKTNLISRFTKNVFHPESKHTIGVEFDCVGMEIDGRRVKAQLWDTGELGCKLWCVLLLCTAVHRVTYSLHEFDLITL